MIAYIFLYSFSACNLMLETVRLKAANKKCLCWFIIILFTFISGTRYYLGGTDYFVYKIVFDNIPTLEGFVRDYAYLDTMYRTFGMENGYLLLNSIIKTMGFNFYGFTLFHSFVFYTLFIHGVARYTDRMWLVMVLFLYKMFFYNTFISLRQSFTIAIFVFALRYIEEKKAKPYFFCCLVCLMLHTAALVLFPLYFINRIKLSKKFLIRLLIGFSPLLVLGYMGVNTVGFLSPILSYIDDPTVLSKADSLISGGGSSGISILHTLEYLGIMVLIVLYYNKIVKEHKYGAFIITILLMLLPIFTIFRNVIILTRIKDYFTIMYAVILGYIFPCNRKNTVLVMLLIIGWCAFGFFRYIILFDNGALMPYESFLWKGFWITGATY